MNRRITFAGSVGVAVFCIILGRLIHLQFFNGARYARQAFREHFRLLKDQPRRGSIFDRNGRLLAVSLSCDSLYADPAEIDDPDSAARKIAGVLGGDADEIASGLRSSRRFRWIRRSLSPSESKRLHALGIDGLYFRRERCRYYPGGEVTAALVGITGSDGRGLEGIEAAQNNLLSGKPGYDLVAVDALARSYQSQDLPMSASVPGKDLYLTIDSAIQYFAQRALRTTRIEEKARWGAAVVLDIPSGDILAMAGVPSFNPNDYATTTAEDRRNNCISRRVEPGSVFKPVVMATALAAEVVSLDERIDCGHGRLKVGSVIYTDWRPFDHLTAADVITFSSNAGIIRIGSRLPASKLIRAAELFGLYEPDSFQLPGLLKGHIPSRKRWSNTDRASLCIGYGISLTALQLAVIYSVFASGGERIAPRLYRDAPSAEGIEAIPEDIASQMKNILRDVITRGTGKKAAPRWYSAAGKTGTSRRYDPETGGYNTHGVTCSFAGFAPADNPRIVVSVIIDDPKIHRWASKVSAPVFREIVDNVLYYLGVPPDVEVPS